MRLMAAAFVGIVGMAGCVEPELGTVEQAETVLEQPAVFASCNGGCASSSFGRVVGEPATIWTSFEGLCKQGWEYTCLEQDYTLTVECSAACEKETPKQVHGHATTRVRPLAPGPLTVTVHFDREVPVGYWGDETETERQTRTVSIGTSYVPEQIAIECVAGEEEVPCSTVAPNPPPVRLSWELRVGSTWVFTQTPFQIVTSLPGSSGYNAWTTKTQGHLDATVTWGGLTATFSTDVARDYTLPRDMVENAEQAPDGANGETTSW